MVGATILATVLGRAAGRAGAGVAGRFVVKQATKRSDLDEAALGVAEQIAGQTLTLGDVPGVDNGDLF